MKETALKLQDKTIFLTGPFNGITQAILRTMTEFGADIAYVSDHSPHASRYVDGINEAREVHPYYGRAAFLNFPVNRPEDTKEALAKMAETFGRMDVLIDANPLAWSKESCGNGLKTSDRLAEEVLPFLKAKQRGRIVFIYEDASLDGLVKTESIGDEARTQLLSQIQKLATKTQSDNVTVNALALGVTEDFILRHFPQNGSIRKCLEELQNSHPQLKLVESSEVALGAAYLASALCASLTGQVLHLTHGFHLKT